MIFDFEQDEITAGGLTIPQDVPFALPAGATYKFLGGWTWVGLGGSGVLHVKDLSDGLILAEARTGAAGFNRGSPEAIALGELLSKVADYARELQDPAALSEAIVVALAGAAQKSVADPVTLAEAIATVMTMFRSVSDPVALSEAIDKLLVSGIAPVEMDDPSFFEPLPGMDLDG